MRTTTVVIGAGHSGLAVSHFLAARSIDHVVIERGEVANSWRKERWDSLRLLTPNWQTRLPGLTYDGDKPDEFMSMAEVVAFIDRYAGLVAKSTEIHRQTTVASVQNNENGYDVKTDQGSWRCRTVVLATGGFNVPSVPPFAAELPPFVVSLTPMNYSRPSILPEGRVLVVGASATGVQIADEVQRSGRPVTLAVGEHVRMPRVYRGKDIQWWMDRTGLLDESYDEVDDIVRARHVPSPQLVGSPERSTLDLNKLSDNGVQLVGRLVGISDDKALFSGSLRNKCNLADLKMGRLLDTIDEWATDHGLDGEVDPPHRYAPTRVDDSPPLVFNLAKEGVKTVIWATGYRPDYSWLHVPVLDRKGQLSHDGGVVSKSPGLYRIGLNFLRRRKSSFMHGAEDDARDIVDHLGAHVDMQPTRGHA